MSRTYHHYKNRDIRVRGIRRPTDLRRLAQALFDLEQAARPVASVVPVTGEDWIPDPANETWMPAPTVTPRSSRLGESLTSPRAPRSRREPCAG